MQYVFVLFGRSYDVSSEVWYGDVLFCFLAYWIMVDYYEYFHMKEWYMRINGCCYLMC